MKHDETIQISDAKKSLRNRHIIAAIWLSLWVIVLFIYEFSKWESKPGPTNEDIIRQALAKQINKDADKITNEDFAKVTSFTLEHTRLSSIKLLSKFTNLQELRLQFIHFPEKDIPKWKKILGKFKVIDLSKKTSINLSPLKNLYALKSLDLTYSQVSDITPLKELVNLETLSLNNTKVSDLDALKGLIHLKRLLLECTYISDLKLINGLTNLEILSCGGTKVKNLEPLQGLINLQQLFIAETQITDIEPLKSLKNLRRLDIDNTLISDLEILKNLTSLQRISLIVCPNITDEQVKDIQKALPDLKIYK